MMKPSILPYDAGSQEIKFLHDNKVTTRIIYVMVLLTIIAFIVALPFINISISIQSRGIIRPLTEMAEIRVIPSAPVARVFITEGTRVGPGDTLLILESDGIAGKMVFIRQELGETQNYIHDLQNLTGKATVSFFCSELYRTQSINFSKKLSEIDFRIERAKQEVARQQPLYDNQLISKKDYESLVNFRDQLENEKKIIEAAQMLQWRSELAAHCTTRDSYISQLEQTLKQLALYTIKSPVAGTIESFSGIYPGCNIQSGQVVAVISPDNTLVAEVFVTAKNIGTLKKGMPVKIEVDAFNYNEWGMISAKINRISEDYILINGIPSFKVQCSLCSTHLQLKNGTKGTIKKGMTVNARFMVARRTLFQLLYQKSDDWLNPARNISGL